MLIPKFITIYSPLPPPLTLIQCYYFRCKFLIFLFAFFKVSIIIYLLNIVTIFTIDFSVFLYRRQRSGYNRFSQSISSYYSWADFNMLFSLRVILFSPLLSYNIFTEQAGSDATPLTFMIFSSNLEQKTRSPKKFCELL